MSWALRIYRALPTPCSAAKSAAYFGRRSQLFAETDYAPLAGGAKLLGLGGGFHFEFGKPGRFAPYATVMGGLGRFSGYGDADNAAVFGVGGGAHCFLGRNWGVRPDIRWRRYQISGSGFNSYVARAGLFYRFGGN